MDRIWEFKTAKLTVFCEWEPEQDEDLSWADEETLEKLASEEWVNATFHVGCMVNGELYADDWLGNSVRDNPPLDFVREHLGIAAWEREMGAKHGTTATACSYFREMVRSCLKETRRKLEREEEYRDRAGRTER